jgi:glycosyltransferase involved in cell wall biosynthesis
MTPYVSVLISTRNPDTGRLERTLNSLAAQTFDVANWELTLVDNASTRPLNIDEALRNVGNSRAPPDFVGNR